MKNILLGIVISCMAFFAFHFYNHSNNERTVVKSHNTLIQESIKNVGKLVVTEGHFSQVFNYSNSKDLFASLISADKKALVVVNAEVTVAYDLSKLEYTIDEINKKLILQKIPEEEIKISPDFEYYDVQADYLNPFDAQDYNTIKDKINGLLLKKIEASSLKTNAKNRLVSELSKFYILTNSLGWTLEYNNNAILNLKSLETLKL